MRDYVNGAERVNLNSPFIEHLSVGPSPLIGGGAPADTGCRGISCFK
jgi:hypothetical protein